MRRSLVGSEMCIRDRRERSAHQAAPGVHRPELLRLPIGAARSRAHHGCCILYTSDAADDLLCVDLGGRRHIKKKKKQH